jgi:hypothetical protein
LGIFIAEWGLFLLRLGTFLRNCSIAKLAFSGAVLKDGEVVETISSGIMPREYKGA